MGPRGCRIAKHVGISEACLHRRLKIADLRMVVGYLLPRGGANHLRHLLVSIRMTELPDAVASTALVDPVLLSEALRPVIESTALERELRSAAPRRLRDALRDAGAFRMLTPREYGGSETPLTTVLGVYEGLGRLDASTGLIVWNANFGFIGALLSDTGARKIFSSAQEPILANSGRAGTAEIVSGGYQLSGEFPIVTGVESADWLVVCAIVTRGGDPCLVDGVPDLRLCAVRSGDFTVEQTWNVNAMRGTGSHNVTIHDVFIPADLVTPPLPEPPRINRPLYRGFIPTLVFAGCTAVTLGVAKSAVDEFTSLAELTTSSKGGLRADDMHCQYTIAKADTAIAAARLLLFDTAGALQIAAQRGDEVTVQQRAAFRAAMCHAAEVSREALVAIYEAAGSSALYRDNPIERMFRDGMAALQHANHSRRFLVAAGRVHLGREPGLPLF
ncbi:MAG: acyl-CoA dehydrogenase family protein [Mycobacterium sp.]